MKFKTHQEIDEHYAKQGVDIEAMHKEFNETKGGLDETIRRVKKRKLFGGIFYNPFGPGLGNLKQEVREEWDKIK